jgi:hypothetical protein
LKTGIIDSKLLNNLSKRLSVFDHYHHNDKADSPSDDDDYEEEEEQKLKQFEQEAIKANLPIVQHGGSAMIEQPLQQQNKNNIKFDDNDDRLPNYLKIHRLMKNISDEDIADIYLTKLKSIDLGRRQQVKQHSSSSMIQRGGDQYANFRSIPNFNAAATQNQKTTNNSDNVKLFGLMKRISGNSNNNN